MRILRKPHPLAMFVVWFLTVFLVLFPKGGIKAAAMPLTWGYMGFGLTTPFLIIGRLLATPLRLPARVWAALFFILPLQLLCGYALYFYGAANLPFTAGMLINLVFLPWVFLVLYPGFFRYIDPERFSRYFRICVFSAAAFGIFLFFLHPITGSFIEIPYLTVNIEDYGDLEYTKHITRGLFFKLISTYNNGNIYGVATLMLMPIYDVLEKSRWRRTTIKVALLLTLARTVWVGLIAAELLPMALLFAKQVKTFPRLYLGQATNRVLALILTIFMIFMVLLLNSFKLSFLFDPTLGGRTGIIGLIFNASLLPDHGLSGFQEVVYSSAAHELGYAGLVAAVLWLFSPLLLLVVDSNSLASPVRRAALKGLLLYALLAASDGAFNYAPVMVFYWFVYMVYLYGWPGASPVAVVSQPSSQVPMDMMASHTSVVPAAQ